MKAKELFKKFSQEQSALLPFCMQYSWWDEVIRDNWDLVVEANAGQVHAIWPFLIRKKGPWKIISNPYFTPYSGPYICYPQDQKSSSRISFENKIHRKLIKQLPDFAELNQNFHLGFSNSLEFIWQNFEDHKHFTYVLELGQGKDSIWEGFRENTRRQIRKAEKSLMLQENQDPALMENLLKATYESQSTAYPEIPTAYYERIFNYLKKHNAGKSWKAIDEHGKIHAAITCIWDAKMAYYLIGGASSEVKNSGAMSLLLWKAIQEAAIAGKQSFNFEGSSVEAIEKYLRGFGGTLTPLSRIIKRSSDTFNLAKKLKQLT